MKNYLSEEFFDLTKQLFRKMRTTCLLILVFASSLFAANVNSQVAKVSLSIKNSSLINVLDAIERQTDYLFVYNKSEIDLKREINMEVKDQSVSTVLSGIFQSTGISYAMEGNNIVLFNKVENLQQQKSVAGKVIDSYGDPLPGVSVVVKGTTTGVITDMDGKYSILRMPENAILIFSFVGMKTQELTVGNKTIMNITLVEDAIGIEEVVAIGYGTVKKSDLTGSVSSVKTGELQQTPMTSIDQGLVGRASGVQVTQTSGMPGAVASIRVRGSSSLQGGNEPLYVIDGFPVYSGSGFGNTGGNVQMSGLSTVNPNDIESIEILKDAAATAIYGARAANGVVLITTKTGKKGHDVVSFEANYGIQNITKKIDVMGAQEYAALVNEAYTNDKLTAPYDATKLAEIAKLGRGTDWQDEIFRVGKTQNYQLTFSGGDEKTSYAISGSYFDQQGVIINSNFKRYSTRLNLDRKINEVFKIGTNFSISHTINNAIATDSGGEKVLLPGR